MEVAEDGDSHAGGGAGTGPVGRGERHLGHQSAAVHRHSLDRLNTVNDSLKKKKPRWGVSNKNSQYTPRRRRT